MWLYVNWWQGCQLSRVANSHAFGVILTNLTCYSRTHAIDKFTHTFKNDHTHTYAILKNPKCSTIFSSF